MRRIAIFMGTRPEAIKMAPVISALEAADGLVPVVVNTGQHRELIAPAIDLFGITVHHDLAIMQPDQSLAGLTSRLISAVDEACQAIAPDMVLAQGDTTTVMATSLVSFYRDVPFGHVEAGLRTFNIRSPFPEEVNRRITSQLSTLHFAPTEHAAENLRRESVDPTTIFVTGNTVIDALHIELARQRNSTVRDNIRQRLKSVIASEFWNEPYVIVTGHRRENFGSGFNQICDALTTLADRFSDHLFIYPVHLNPRVKRIVSERLAGLHNVRLIDPQPYAEFVCLLSSCRIILTDSGGVQEEAPGLGKPVLVMRDTTERPEGVEAGTVKLVGPVAERIVRHTSELLEDNHAYQQMAGAINPYGDGRAAPRITKAIHNYLHSRTT